MTAGWVVCCVVLVLAARGRAWTLVWEDQFDTLDPAKWDHEINAWGGGNGEFQFYSDDNRNSYVRDGILYILPTQTKDNTNPLTGQPFGDQFLVNGVLDVTGMYGRCNMPGHCWKEGADIPPVMSARLRTAGRFSFTYGKVEIRAKMPVGDWMFPAIWMLPTYPYEYGDWPRSGEIDIVESLGNPDLVSPRYGSYGVDRMVSTMYWGPAWDNTGHHLAFTVRHNTSHNYGETFHLFTLEWDENGIRWLADGQEVMRRPDPPIDQQVPAWQGWWEYGQPWKQGYTNPWGNKPMAPFDAPFHLILNVAVGTTTDFIPDDLINRGGTKPKPWTNSDPDAMQKFWAARDDWYPTWVEEQAAMQVDWIRVYQRDQTATTTPGSACSSCPQGYAAPFQGSCYSFSTFGTNWWDAAYNRCTENGGQLVSIETSAEQAHLTNHMASNPDLTNACDYFWTSGNDLDEEGTFMWHSTGRPVEYAAWAPGQPDNYLDEDHCIEMKKEFGWLWNDASGHSSWPCWICEKPATCG